MVYWCMTTTAAEEHRRIAGRFTELVRGVPDGGWDAPSPVEEWVARDVVRHLVEWFPAFLESGAGVHLAKGPSVDDDPVAAWVIHSDAVQALLDDPATAGKTLSNRHVGDVPLDRATSPGRPARTRRSMRTSAPSCSPGWCRTRTLCVPAVSTGRASR
jgi:hypothetical protein